MNRPLKIAIVGTRGFPNVQGGVERHCEKLSINLAALGCDVTVFTRKPYVKDNPREYKGVKLLALPAMLFPCFEEGQRSVHRDSHVEVQHAYYEVPAEHIGRTVWVRWDSRLVRIFNQRQEQIAVHARVTAGQFSAQPAGRPAWQVARSADYWCQRARVIGPHCGQWAEQVRSERGVAAIRVLIGLQQLVRRAGASAVEAACGQALTSGLWRLRDLRRLLERRPAAEQLTFLTHHPLIRDLQEYGRLVTPPPELPTAAPAGQVGPFSAAMDNSSAAES